MKKLLTTMSAVAAAMSLFATDSGALSGTSFEGLGAGPYSITAKGIANGGELGEFTDGTTTYWVTNSTATLEIVGAESSVDTRPAAFDSYNQESYLSIKTTLGNPVSRRVTASGLAESIGAGLYFDSLVKFTAFDGDQTVDLGLDGKLAIWLKENEDGPSTNLIITAGYIDSNGDATVTNYTCTVLGNNPNLLDDGGWHRVTVRMINSIFNSTTTPAFLIAIDEHRVYCNETKFVVPAGDSLTREAAAFDAEHSLFPSALQSGASTSISAVSFDGQGCVDDLVFTRTQPDCVKDPDFFTITISNDVASAKYALNGGSPVTITNTTGSGTVSVTVPFASGTYFTISDVIPAPGYMKDEPYDLVGNMSFDGSLYTPVANSELVIKAKPLGAYVNDTPYPTLEAAVFAANQSSSDCTVKLAADATAGVTINNANATITIDLAGKTLTATASDAAAIYVQGGTVIVTNSTVEVGTVQAAENAGALGNAVNTRGTASLTLQAGVYNGTIKKATSITGGSFLASHNNQVVNTSDALNEILAGTGYEVTLADNYYTLTAAAPTYTITFETGRADATVDPGTTNFVAGGAAITLPTPVIDPPVTGVMFGGWTNETITTAITEFTPPQTGAASFTLYAKWDPVAPSTLTLVSGDNSTVDPSSYSFFAGGAAIALPTPTLNSGVIGVTFGGWTNETITTATMTFTPPAEAGDVTLYAKWDAVAPCTITFETGRADATVDPASTNFWAGQATITLPTPVLDPQTVGVTFGGWTNETITTAITEYTPPAENAEGFTLYAKWDAVVVNYPTYIDSEDTTVVNQYNAWKATYGADTASAYETEFLLNVAPDATDKTLDTTAVSISGTTVTIDIDHGNLNGYPYVKKAATLAGLATATPEAIPVVPADGNNKENGLDNGGRVTIENQSGASMFYQIGVQATPVAVPNNNAD